MINDSSIGHVHSSHTYLVHEGVVDYLAPVEDGVVVMDTGVGDGVLDIRGVGGAIAVFHEEDVPVVQRVGGGVEEVGAQARRDVVAEPVVPVAWGDWDVHGETGSHRREGRARIPIYLELPRVVCARKTQSSSERHQPPPS